jgi:hypothetical protein
MRACTHSVSHSDTKRRTPWAHVPIATLFAEHNPLARRPDGTVRCGHEPFHGSRSGRCVIIWPSTGYWWCSSCRTGGDAVTYVMARDGCVYAAAVQWLGERYGFPKSWQPGWRERASWPRIYAALSAPPAPSYVRLSGGKP